MRKKPIKTRHVRGWTEKISLVLIFTLAIFLLQGWYGPNEAQAALEYVGGASGSGTGATYNVSLTGLTGGSGSAAAAGDLVIVVTGWASAADGNPGVTTAGYTEVYNLYGNDTRDANLSVSWKIMGATPDTSVTVSGFNNAANGGATVVHVWRGADQTTPMDVVPPVGVTGNNGALPDSPSITPVTAGAYVLTVGLGTGDATPVAQTAPTGYSNAVSAAGTGSTMSAIANIASIAWTSGAEDPLAWSGGESTTSDSMAAGTLAIMPAPEAPPSSGGLLHNSTTTGSTKWPPNGWGILGGRYGEFTCETCHVKSTADIKRIRETITAPSSPTLNFPGGASSPVVFPSTTSFGNDAGNSPRASSDKICEVCHTYDSTDPYDSGVNAHPYNSAGATLTNHKSADGTDCTSCHKHDKGFKASCDLCHGYPPTVSTPGGPDGLADNNGGTAGGTTGSTIVGAHASHVNTGSIACASCHYGSSGQGATHNNGDLNITLGFYLFNGAAQGGAYDGQTTANYNATTTTPATTTTKLGGKTCSTVYCHGSTINPVANPAWDSTVACGDCHKTTNADPPTIVNHPRHAGTAAGQLNLACTKCHPDRSVSWDGHVDASVQWDLDRLDAKLGSTASYRAAELGNTGTKAPSSPYGSCTSVYCHSTVQNNGATGAGTFNTVTWGGGALTCTTACHTENPSTGSHDLHVTTQGYLCSACHNNAGDETSLHANNLIDLGIQNAGTYSQGSHAPAPTNTGYGTCSTTWCHGTNSGTWGANTTNAACTKCHGNPTAVASYVLYKAAPGADGPATGTGVGGVDTAGNTGTYTNYVSNDPQVGAHNTHLNSTRNYSSDIACNECHTVPAAVGDAGHFGALPVELTWGTLATANSAVPGFTGSGSTPTCTNTYCHFGKSIGGYAPATANASVLWTNTAYLTGTPNLTGDCGKCHASPPSATGTHNGITNINQCISCHDHVTATGAFSDVTKHINGAVEAQGGCLGCHGAVKGTAPDQFRAVTTDFAQPSRHVFGGTVKDFDCIVCHAEGDTTSAGTAISTTAQHNDAGKTIAMRNVDQAANPGTSFVAPGTFGTWTNNFWQWPKPSVTPTANDHSNMDKFCMSCHDANGASLISVKATFDGIDTGAAATRDLTPFSQNTIGGSLTDFGARTRVLDVKTQFKNDATAGSNEWPAGNGTLPTTFDTLAEGQGYDGNPSQHAVLGPRYATNNASLGGWVAMNLKSGQALATVKEKAQLHCADCHTVDTNAHGSANQFMMVQSTIDATCYTCHSNTVYTDPAAAGSRVDHSMCGNTFNAGMEAIFGTSFCFNCHGGAKANSPYGWIHGMPSGTDPDYAATYSTGKNPIEERYRFMGGQLGAWKTGAWPGAWNTSGTAPTCYMRSSANAYTNCTRHVGASTGSKGSTNFVRELRY